MVSNNTVIDIKGLTKNYGEKRVFHDLSFSILENETVGLVGLNGAGKTTLIDIILGLKKQTDGSVEIANGLEVKKDFGVMLQEVSLPEDVKVKELIQLVSSFSKNPFSEKDILEIAGLEAEKNSLTQKLSGGLQRRVQFALAISGQPKVLILDEPTVGLDIEARFSFWKQLQELRNKNSLTVIIISHDLDELSNFVDRLIVLHQGKIALDSQLDDLKKKPKVKDNTVIRTAFENILGGKNEK